MVMDTFASSIRQRPEAVLERHQHGGVLGDGGFAEHAGDEMGLRRDLERVAQSGNLVRYEVLDHLARALDRVLALHHEIEIEVVDERDQHAGQAFMRAEHFLQPRHVALAGGRSLEIGELDQRGNSLLETVELGPLGKLGELLLCAAARRP